MTEALADAPYMHPHLETDGFRVPSRYPRCRRAHCTQPPVADMRRERYRRSVGLEPTWWAYCTEHLADYNREVRDGQVWWRGVTDG